LVESDLSGVSKRSVWSLLAFWPFGLPTVDFQLPVWAHSRAVHLGGKRRSPASPHRPCAPCSCLACGEQGIANSTAPSLSELTLRSRAVPRTEDPSQRLMIHEDVEFVKVEITTKLPCRPNHSPTLDFRDSILFVNPVLLRTSQQFTCTRS
jgi:hypothetical protein